MRTVCALMVMPRSRSRSMASSTWACISRGGQRTGEFEQAVGEGGLAVIDVRDDREVADVAWVHEKCGRPQSLHVNTRALPVGAWLWSGGTLPP